MKNAKRKRGDLYAAVAAVDAAHDAGFASGVRATHDLFARHLAKCARNRDGNSTGELFDELGLIACELIESVAAKPDEPNAASH